MTQHNKTLQGEYPTVAARVANEFSWGNVQHVHEIGGYLIVEYFDRLLKAYMFHPYILNFGIDWTRPETRPRELYDTAHGYYSLDEAIVGAITIRHEGLNSQLDHVFWAAIRGGKIA